MNIGSELEEELEAKVAQELEKCLQLGPNLDEEWVGHPLVQTESLTDCTAKNEITNQVVKLQENAKGKVDILKLLKWPREAMM